MNTLDKAIYDYHNTTKTVSAILKEYNISKTTFYRHLDYKEEKRKKYKARLYTYDINSFIIDSHEKFYWLGFIAADGAVVDNTLTIELKSLDKEHLIKFNIFFKNTNPLKERVNNLNVQCVKTQIHSYELVEYLRQYNIIQNKSKIFTIPTNKIPQEFLLDFVRGMIDGDGCIRINNHQQISLSFCSGNKECVEQIKSILKIDNKTRVDKNTYSFQVTGNIKAKAILDKIYESSTENTRLNRKYSIYKTLN